MAKKKKSANNNNNNNNGGGSGGGNGGGSKTTKDNSRGGGGSSGYYERRYKTINANIPEIKRILQETAFANFSSSELTYKGSDRIVFITNGQPIKNDWKFLLGRRKPLEPCDIRSFISSTLVATDYQSGDEVEELVSELGDPESGLKILKEIINFRSMSCDAGLNNHTLSFQYVILPLLGLLTRTSVTECILENYVHAIYMAVYSNLDSFLFNNVMTMLETLVQRNSIVDYQVSVETLLSHEPYLFIPSSLGIFFLIIVRLLTELLRRIKEASNNETMHKIAQYFQQLKNSYQQILEQQPPTDSTDPLINNWETRKYFFMVLEREIKIMNKILNNRRISESKEFNSNLTRLNSSELARKADAERSYDPPGKLSKYGIRHDNDFKEISDISIIPTREEILCNRPPFLPFSFPDAPHFLPDGVTRLFDTQFRLLREDMLNPIRNGLSNFLTALSSSNNSEELKKIQEEGGKFQCDNGDLQVYSHVQFVDITCDRMKGFACTVRFTPPKIYNAIDENNRREYWEKSQRLLPGSLITLLLPNSNPRLTRSNYSSGGSTSNSDLYSLYFGVVTSRDVVALAKYIDYAEININFMDPSIYSIAVHEISNYDKITIWSLGNRFMVESTGTYLEAYYHVLKNLQTTIPSSLPFEKYLAPSSEDLNRIEGMNNIDVKIENPMYTRAPGFQFDLSVLCKYKERLKLNVTNANTHDEVVKNITKYSNISKLDNLQYGLDETQAKALISALTREIALIEGPPGTGKTVVGVQLMKVLLAKENRGTNIGPILTICFTNHALDQFLEHLLDENITNLVRLGSRTQSERIKEFNIEEVCKNRGNKKLLRISHEILQGIEEEVDRIRNILFSRFLSWSDLRKYLMTEEKQFYNKFNYVSNNDLPSWVLETNDDDDTGEGSWNSVQNKQTKHKSVFEKWLHGDDIKIINKRKVILINQQKEEEEKKVKINNMKKNKKWVNFGEFELMEEQKRQVNIIESQIDHKTIEWIKNYNTPRTDRPLNVLLKNYSMIWQMSLIERQKLHDYWRTKVHKGPVDRLLYLQEKHEKQRQVLYKIYDERRRQTLLNCDVIGMTTNGAAKFQNLIRSIGPKIIICEEAGEVLEAHILSALTPSTQHLILIGDHNQLRPHIATYSLSMDSSMGKNHQLDKSLFERLVHGDKAVKIEKTQLLTQRRMRKEISDLIRYTLYPNLIDGENTTKYPNVRGAQHNVYFVDHRHPEDNVGGELATKSHVNRYEVKMVVEMVKYFVRNGYTKPDDIAVLTPYLGQMIKIRDALAKSFVVVIDERDAQNLSEMEEERKGKNKNESEMKGERKGKNKNESEMKGERKGKNKNESEMKGERKGKNKNENKNVKNLSEMKEERKGRNNDENKNVNDGNINVVSEQSLNQQVALRTVDNFQGEEATIVIVSLVRNFSGSPRIRDSIGFLKSSNRTNVLLSRAREGMYLIGNSELMASKSKDMWAPVIDMLQTRNPSQVGFGMPIVCNQHPDYKNIIIEPERFAQVSPDGGCNRPCRILLPCKHKCIYKCHSDDPEHIGIKCPEPCARLHPKCKHPCPKICFEDCGDCNVPVGDIKLPNCGHVLQNAMCWQNKNKKTLNCMTLASKNLPRCEHSKTILCYESAYNVECREKCRVILKCGHECLDDCFECQKLSTPQKKFKIFNKIEELNEKEIEAIIPIERTQHSKCKRLCNKLYPCGHKCGQHCHEGECPPCMFQCMISCKHTRCDKGCLEPCATCAEKCLWECKHDKGRCELSCGVPCYRLPCNERCGNVFFCGHRCAGICGEVCPLREFCVICAPERVKNQKINDTTFSKIDWTKERMIILTCGHVFTMEVMDMHMGMKDYYEGSTKGGWTSIKALPTSQTKIKTCPMCKTPIKDIMRYGRIIKKYILDAQIKNFITTYDNRLKRTSSKIIPLENEMKNKRFQLKNYLSKFDSRYVAFKEYNITSIELLEITPYQYFENIKQYHGFDTFSEQVWIAHVGKLLKCYQELTLIILATKTPPYKEAFEAAAYYHHVKKGLQKDMIAGLSNLHISGASSSNFVSSNTNTSRTALSKPIQLKTLSQVGISIPQEDRRIYLDAISEIINIQKILYNEILFIIQEISNESKTKDLTRFEEVWKNFAERLQLSIKRLQQKK